MQLVKPELASHWYDFKDGVWIPMYELPKKSGDGMKKVTLREARELNLKPSITSVLSIINKPGLEAWKQEQAILSALTLPKLPDEPLDDFVQRVLEDMEAQSEKARLFGSNIHRAIETYFNDEPIPPEMTDYLKYFSEWADKEIVEVYGSEVIVGDEQLGVAGRLDLLCNLNTYGYSVVDFKSQGIKKDKIGIKQPQFHKDWALQLAAYSHCVGPRIPDGRAKLVSVVIDSSEPGPVFVKEWPDYEKHWRHFQYCLELWCEDRGYNPSLKI